jgi:hypothetical protein
LVVGDHAAVLQNPDVNPAQDLAHESMVASVLQAKRRAVAASRAPAKTDFVPLLLLFEARPPGEKKLVFNAYSWSAARAAA